MRAPLSAILIGSLTLTTLACRAPETTPDAGVSADAGADAGIEYPAPFEVTAFDSIRISSHDTDPHFQKAIAEIDWGTSPKKKVTLHVQLDTTCFPFDTWSTNPPPAGHNWPEDCDAFDRNFEFVLDPASGENDPPGIELVRAITPFGGPLTLELDVTDIANARPGKHQLQVFIATWSDPSGQVSGAHGGWNVSARFEVEPGPPPRNVLAVIPLFNGSWTQAGRSPSFAYEIPEGTVDGKIEYRVTGHGGPNTGPNCIGPAEEFCRRSHLLLLDDEVADEFEPWRTDCDQLCTLATHTWPSGSKFQYCAENPCGAQGSVRAPRANWCPGSVTPPYLMTYDITPLIQPGAHSFAWEIDRVEEGGVWRVSATYFAYGN